MGRSTGKGVPLRQVARTFADCKPLFFAMGDSMRQQIILMLEQADELNVSQLTEKLPLSRPAISHHLKVLRQAGLVGVRRQGTENFYSLTIDDALKRLQRFVYEVENCKA
jgi:DNA-binding transcriptional ArsR family regulator